MGATVGYVVQERPLINVIRQQLDWKVV